MQEEKKPPDPTNSHPDDMTIENQSLIEKNFPLKNIFEDTLEHAREISKKYSVDGITDKEE